MGDKIRQDRCLVGNCCIPNINTSNIPFPFSYLKNNQRHLVLSNVFYYEITIEELAFRPIWDNWCISIGFGKIGTNVMKQIGWERYSIGYHSDDGKIFYQNKVIKQASKWKEGDTVGCGIIYGENDKNIIFFTKNGKIINKLLNISLNNTNYYPIIGLDSTFSIKINFSRQSFKFDIEKFIQQNDDGNIVSSNKIFVQNQYRLEKYKWIPKKLNKMIIIKIKKLIEIQLNNLQSN